MKRRGYPLATKLGAQELLKLGNFVHVCPLCGAADHEQVKLANGWTLIGCPKCPPDYLIPDVTEEFMKKKFEEEVRDQQMNAVFPIDGKEKGPTSSEAEPVCVGCQKTYEKCSCIPF